MSREEKKDLLMNVKETLEEVKTGRVISQDEKEAWMKKKEMEQDEIKEALIEKINKRRSVMNNSVLPQVHFTSQFDKNYKSKSR